MPFQLHAIFVVGPTCAGKTKLGVTIAQGLQGEVVSVDSLQCYRHAGVMTARPTDDETKGVPHHLVSYLDCFEEPNDDWTRRLLCVLDDMKARGKTPILVGGSTSLLIPTIRTVMAHGFATHVLLLCPLIGSGQYVEKVRERVDEMVVGGLLDEVSELRSLAKQHPDTAAQDKGIWKSIGYAELLPYANATKTQPDREELLCASLDRLVASTVRYAFRQEQWLHHDLVPFLHAHAVSFSSFPFRLEEGSWERDVRRRALSTVLDICHPWNRVPGPALETKRPVVCIFAGSSEGSSPKHTESAVALAQAFHKRGVKLVYGGGATGMMAALARELVGLSGSAAVHGFIPLALAEYEEKQGAVHDEEKGGRRTIVLDMHARKRLMMQQVIEGGSGSGFVALSGGYGTAEELLEVVTWRQIGLHSQPVCAFNVEGFYDGLVSWLHTMADTGFVHEKDRSILSVARTADEVLESLSLQPLTNSHGLDWS